jgi:hypothetical protein
MELEGQKRFDNIFMILSDALARKGSKLTETRHAGHVKFHEFVEHVGCLLRRSCPLNDK